LNTTVGQGIWYDTFQVQNTKWLWLVNNIVTTMYSDNMICGCFGIFPSYVAGILNSVKKSISMFFVIKEDYDVLATLKNVLLEKSALLSYVQITTSC
jgi:hypothetical protein